MTTLDVVPKKKAVPSAEETAGKDLVRVAREQGLVVYANVNGTQLHLMRLLERAGIFGRPRPDPNSWRSTSSSCVLTQAGEQRRPLPGGYVNPGGTHRGKPSRTRVESSDDVPSVLVAAIRPEMMARSKQSRRPPESQEDDGTGLRCWPRGDASCRSPVRQVLGRLVDPCGRSAGREGPAIVLGE